MLCWSPLNTGEWGDGSGVLEEGTDEPGVVGKASLLCLAMSFGEGWELDEAARV
ncbi:MAG: hypothetical protein Fur0032_13250 [Terrimicrobiaceae bacterium]